MREPDRRNELNKLKKYFIEPEGNIDVSVRQNASYVRKEFDVTGELESASMIATALGLYRPYLNGEELDERFLLPGFTCYEKRLQVQCWDVKDRLVRGRNAIGAVIGDGWYRGRIGLFEKTNFWGEKTAFLCVLKLVYKDGRQDTVVTDSTWKATQDGPIRCNDLKSGEDYDARKEMPGWNKAGFDDTDWHGVFSGGYAGNLVYQKGEPVLEQESFSPAVLKTPDGNTVLDFGQNLAGHIWFRVNGPEGHMVTLTHGETLDEHGNFTLKNLQVEGEVDGKVSLGEAFGQVVHYTCGQGTREYKGLFYTAGFQYVKLENWPEEIRPENFRAIAMYSDIRVRGHFTCSNPLINQLVENVKWSERSNFIEIPTDCPTRERAGWGGDIAIFAEPACYLSDPYKFLDRWMEDVALSQHEDGNLPFIVPEIGLDKAFDGAAGWSDVIYIVPMILYRYYGDPAILEKYYDNIRRWVEFNRQRAKAKHPDHADRNEPYWDFIVDTGAHFGEWLEPGSVMTEDAIKGMTHPDAEVATAYFADAARSLSEIAGILGKKEDEAVYAELFEQIKDAYHKVFMPEGTVVSDRQCRFVRPIQMNLVTDEEKARIAAELNRMVTANDYKIGTGFLTTPRVLKVLSDHGFVDTAYKMLENTKQPGWLYAVTKGATTIWENWLGKDDNNVPVDSMNHYSPGSVVTWLFNTVCGITAAEPGFETIRIRPVPGGSLTFAQADIVTCKGPLSAGWTLENGTFELKLTTPVRTQVELPDQTKQQVEAGNYTFTCSL